MPDDSMRHARPSQLLLPLAAPSTTPLTTSSTTSSTTSDGVPPVSRSRRLVTAIRAALGDDVRVVITDNRTTLLSMTEGRDGRVVRVHQMFLDATPAVLDAVGRYLASGCRASGQLLDAFIDAHDHLVSFAAKPLPTDAAQGVVHDLAPIFAELNDVYFAGALVVELGWGLSGRPARGRARRSIVLGSYDARVHRIVLHPALDQTIVPRLCVARVLHHEMLHVVHPEGRDSAGRRIIHTRAFRRDEARFAGAIEADRWIDRHLDALLRFRPAVRSGAAQKRSDRTHSTVDDAAKKTVETRASTTPLARE